MDPGAAVPLPVGQRATAPPTIVSALATADRGTVRGSRLRRALSSSCLRGSVPVGATARSSTLGTRRRCLQVFVQRRACRWSLTRRNAVAMLWLGAEAAPAPPC